MDGGWYSDGALGHEVSVVEQGGQLGKGGDTEQGRTRTPRLSPWHPPERLLPPHRAASAPGPDLEKLKGDSAATHGVEVARRQTAGASVSPPSAAAAAPRPPSGFCAHSPSTRAAMLPLYTHLSSRESASDGRRTGERACPLSFGVSPLTRLSPSPVPCRCPFRVYLPITFPGLGFSSL